MTRGWQAGHGFGQRLVHPSGSSFHHPTSAGYVQTFKPRETKEAKNLEKMVRKRGKTLVSVVFPGSGRLSHVTVGTGNLRRCPQENHLPNFQARMYGYLGL
jgi:hypothetical protein